MSRLFVDESFEYLTVASIPVADEPITMAAYVYQDEIDIQASVIGMYDTAAHNRQYLTVWSDELVYAASVAAGSVAEAVTSTTITLNTWEHVCAVFAADDDRRVYLNGGNKGTNALSRAVSGLDVTVIGAGNMAGTPGYYWSGRIAEAAIWNAALTDTEVALLAQGYSPLFVQPQNLVFYVPLVRDNDEDIIGGVSLTAGGTPEIAEHPRVIYPSPKLISFPAEAAGDNFYKTLSDSVGLTDTLTKSVGRRKTLAEPIGVTDTVLTARGMVKVLLDTIGVTDALSKVGTFIKTLADTVGITDTIVKSTGRFVTLADTVGIADTLSKIGTFFKTITDPVGITDALSRSSGRFITLAESVGITDALSAIVKKVVLLADAVGVTDTISKVGGFFRTITDAVGITDAISKVGAFFKTISDTVGVTDTLSRAAGFFRSIVDAIGLTDLITALKEIFRESQTIVSPGYLEETIVSTGYLEETVGSTGYLEETINSPMED